MKGIFSVLVENRDGVLSAVSGLFARRGFNIDTLAVGETENHEISSMTITSTGDQRTIDQIEKQLNKNVDVIKVRRLSESKSVCLEMMLIKVSCTLANRAALIDLCKDILTPLIDGKLRDLHGICIFIFRIRIQRIDRRI